MSDETPFPPEIHQPNTPRTWLRRSGDWLLALVRAHPDKAFAAALIVAAFVLGRCSV